MKKYTKLISAKVLPLVAVSAGLVLASCGTGIEITSPTVNKPAASTNMFAIVASHGDDTVYSVPVGKSGAVTTAVSGISVNNPIRVAVNSTHTCGFALADDGTVRAFSIGAGGQLATVGALSAVTTATPGNIIVHPSDAWVLVSGIANGVAVFPMTNANCSLGTLIAAVPLTTGGNAHHANGIAISSNGTSLFTAGTGATPATDGGVGVFTFNTTTGAITPASTTFQANTAAADIPTFIGLSSDGLRGFVGNYNGTNTTSVDRYTTTATAVTGTARTTAQPVGHTCPGFAVSASNAVAVQICSGGTLALTSYILTATDATAGNTTGAVAGISNLSQVAIAPNLAADVSDSVIVIATDGAAAAAGRVLSYLVNRTTGAFTAVNSISGLTNPRGVVVISQTY